jgi:hypothetical protein
MLNAVYAECIMPNEMYAECIMLNAVYAECIMPNAVAFCDDLKISLRSRAFIYHFGMSPIINGPKL